MTRAAAEAREWQEMHLEEHLRLTVPLHILDLAGSTDAELITAAAASAKAVGAQGDTLMFGSRRRIGQGEADAAAHAAHVGGSRQEHCPVCMKGQADYSSGETASLLARGLAAAAILTGSADFRDLHWCTAPHEDCPRGNG